MAERPPEVRNPSDPRQVRGAARREERREQRRLAYYRAVLNTEAGRFVFWDLVLKMGVFATIWTPNGAELNARVARRDFGLEVMRDLQLIDGDRFQEMEREWWAREKRDAAETEASHAATSTPGEDQ